MELGYITFSAEEQQLVHDVLQQINQGAIDELGLGRIRDAFSDLMFPGMSTLHRKSKYFVLLPALYNQLAQTVISDRKQIPDLIRQWEINMTISLMKGNTNHEGITGSSIAIDKLKNGQFVKIRPTHIYLSSLKYYGLVDDKMNLTDLIYQQSQMRQYSLQKGRRTKKAEEEDLDDVDSQTGFAPSFFPFTGYNFSPESPISLQLTAYEAQILREMIINRCCRDGNDNLYSYILKNDDIEIKPDFFEMESIIKGIPEELRRVYTMASDFSKWAHLMNTYYRYAFYCKMSPDDVQARANEGKQKAHIEYILNKGDYPKKDRLAVILPKFTDVNGLRQFCLEASECLEINNENALIDLIIKRERKIKGNHYKIGNERYKETNFSDFPGYYAYRWNEIVYSMVNDIRNPQQ